MSEVKVFIASTFDDLQDVREAIGEFIRSCGHKPERWETGSIPHDLIRYDPGGAVSSAVRAVGEADIAVVIIGKKYGSKPQDLNGLSVTECEYESAKRMAVPIYVFVNSPVYEEHRRLKKAEPRELVMTADEEVHRFIDRIEHDFDAGGALIFQFKNFDDIVVCLRQQWSALFGKYLRDKRKCSACSGRMMRELDFRARQGAQAIQPNRLLSFVIDAAEEAGSSEVDAYVFSRCIVRSRDFESFCQELSRELGREFRIDRVFREDAIREYQRARDILQSANADAV